MRFQNKGRFIRRLLGGATLGYALFLRHRWLTWGTQGDEKQRLLRGDDVVAVPRMQATRAINIGAPAVAVWPWLTQMGRERSGFYSFDRLTNWGIPSVTYLRHDIPPVQLGTRLDNDLKVLVCETEKRLLVGGFDIPTIIGKGLDISYEYLLYSHGDTTRLLVRTRAAVSGPIGWVYCRAFEILDSLIIIEQLRGIQRRAENTTTAHTFASMPLPENTVRHPIHSLN